MTKRRITDCTDQIQKDEHWIVAEQNFIKQQKESEKDTKGDKKRERHYTYFYGSDDNNE